MEKTKEISKPCKHRICKHYKEDLSTNQYKKMKYCGECGRAIHNKTSASDEIRLRFTRADVDKFITIDAYRRERYDIINTLAGVGVITLVVFLSLWGLNIIRLP